MKKTLVALFISLFIITSINAATTADLKAAYDASPTNETAYEYMAQLINEDVDYATAMVDGPAIYATVNAPMVMQYALIAFIASRKNDEAIAWVESIDMSNATERSIYYILVAYARADRLNDAVVLYEEWVTKDYKTDAIPHGMMIAYNHHERYADTVAVADVTFPKLQSYTIARSAYYAARETGDQDSILKYAVHSIVLHPAGTKITTTVDTAVAIAKRADGEQVLAQTLIAIAEPAATEVVRIMAENEIFIPEAFVKAAKVYDYAVNGPGTLIVIWEGIDWETMDDRVSLKLCNDLLRVLPINEDSAPFVQRVQHKQQVLASFVK